MSKSANADKQYDCTQIRGGNYAKKPMDFDLLHDHGDNDRSAILQLHRAGNIEDPNADLHHNLFSRTNFYAFANRHTDLHANTNFNAESPGYSTIRIVLPVRRKTPPGRVYFNQRRYLHFFGGLHWIISIVTGNVPMAAIPAQSAPKRLYTLQKMDMLAIFHK